MESTPREERVRGAVRLGSLAGIGVYVHWSFLILIGWVLYVHFSQGSTWTAALNDVGFVLAIFGCVVLHELGHALMARRFGIRTRNITLLPIGGVANLERMPERPAQEFWVAVAGPAVNVAIAGLLFIIVLATSRLTSPESMLRNSADFFDRLLWVNVFLVVFNMIPAFPMDGGRVLRAILATGLEYPTATRIAARIGQVFAVLFAIAGFLINPFLILIGVFVFFAGMQEIRAVDMRAAMHRGVVYQAMLSKFVAITPDRTVAEAIDAARSQPGIDLPVVLPDGRYIGLLTRDDVIRLEDDGDVRRPLAEAVAFDAAVAIAPNAPLDEALMRMSDRGLASLPVVHKSRLVGLVTLDLLERFLAARQTPGAAA